MIDGAISHHASGDSVGKILALLIAFAFLVVLALWNSRVANTTNSALRFSRPAPPIT
jgi:hypothetical protein